MGKIFVTSDYHYGHKNISGPSLSNWDHGYRAFPSVEEMNECLIQNTNDIISENDTLYHLGDFAMGPRNRLPEYRNRINCKTIIQINGNHDDSLIPSNRKYDKEHKKLFSSVQGYLEIRHKGILFCMFHYPLGSWNEIGRNSINLFGHCHGTYKFCRGRQMDVGVDTNNYKPYLLEDIIDMMDSVSSENVDHHTSETSYH